MSFNHSNDFIDINECTVDVSTICGGSAAGSCTNYVGGYSCTCNPGYEKANDGTLSETCTGKI